MAESLDDQITRVLGAAHAPPESERGRTRDVTESAVIHRLDAVTPEPIDWLWPGRIAARKLSLIQGDPGLGKSLLSLDLAARVSAGAPWPDQPSRERAPGGVVLLNAEDDVADTVRPRLDAAGADVSRIVAIDTIRSSDGGVVVSRSPDLSRDLGQIERAIGMVPDCRLIVVDPISAYLGQTDSHKNSDIRGVLAPFSQLAAAHRLAIVAVTHMNKNTAGPAVHRTSGSLAFPAAARAVWVVAKDREDVERRLFLPVKNNIGADSSGLAYRVREAGGTPLIRWEADPVTVSADEALAPRAARTAPMTEEACEWLRDALVDGPLPARTIRERALADGIKERTLQRAKAMLRVQATREGYASNGAWVWATRPHGPAANGRRQVPGTGVPDTPPHDGDKGTPG